jgi:hypothetical protein
MCSIYDVMIAFIAIIQPYSQGPFHLLEEGVLTPDTKSFRTRTLACRKTDYQVNDQHYSLSQLTWKDFVVYCQWKTSHNRVYLPPLDGVLTGLTFGGSGFSFSGLSLLSDFPGRRKHGVVK